MKSPILPFLTLSFCRVSAQRYRDKFERICTSNKQYPIRRYQDRFANSNALMAKWRLQTLSFKKVTDKQTKNVAPWRRAMAKPHQTWRMTEEEVLTIVAHLKHVRIRRRVSPLGALKMWGNEHTPKLKPR